MITPLRLTTILAVLLMFGGCDRGALPSTTGNSMTPFAAGQIWTYATRPGEEASRIVICRVEADPKLGQIVHINVTGVHMKNSQAPGGYSSEVGHMPYEGESLRKSVVNLESTGARLPNFEEGYQLWRSAFDEHKAGVWKMAVAEAISSMESALANTPTRN